jgi:hypothetical protein
VDIGVFFYFSFVQHTHIKVYLNVKCSQIRLKDHLKQLVHKLEINRFVSHTIKNGISWDVCLNNTAHKSSQLMCQQPSLPWTPTHKEHLRLKCLYTESAAKIVISLATERFRNSLLRCRNNIFLARWNAAPNPSRKKFLKLERSLPSQFQRSMRWTIYRAAITFSRVRLHF